LSGEVHLVQYDDKKYVVRRCRELSKARLYEDISKKFEKYGFLPKFLGRFGKDVLYEYIEGRDLREKEEMKVFEQIGKISAHVNKFKIKGDTDKRFKKQLNELVSGEFDFGVKETERRKRNKVKKKPKPIFSEEKEKQINYVFNLLKKKSKPIMALDANDITPGNFRLGKNGRIYFVDIEAIKPRIKGFGIAKFYLQWGKTPARVKAFNKGYSSISSMKFLTQEYKDFIFLNFIIQKINYSIKIFRRDYSKQLVLLDQLLERYS
jgi:thiamine kinase-like enzyme